VTSGTVSLCTVSGIEEGGTVPYCTESERTGTVTATSEFFSKSKCDLLSVVGDINKPGFCVTGSGKFSIDDFRKRVGIWIMIIAVRIIYRILYEFNNDTGEITKSSELYCSMSTAVDFYPVQMVKQYILHLFYHLYG